MLLILMWLHAFDIIRYILNDFFILKIIAGCYCSNSNDVNLTNFPKDTVEQR